MTGSTTMVPMNDLKRHFAPLQEELAEALADVVAGGRYILGDACTRFEGAFAGFCGVPHCVGVANGTDALELALRAIGIGRDSRVIMTANAGMYTTAATLAIGARPVFVDIEPDTMGMSPGILAAALERESKVDAIVVTHLYGRMADMPALLAVARGIPIIEDCAQAHGAVLAGKGAGAWGVAGCFSFYPTKNLGAVGDAGAVVTADATLADRLRELRQYGWTERYRATTRGGRNSRLDELQAAAMLVLLPHLPSWNQRRQQVAARYRSELSGRSLTFAPEAPAGSDVSHLCVVRSKARERLRATLSEHGVATDVHYPIPDHLQEAVIAVVGRGPALPETERAAAEIVSLPCFPELTNAEVEAVIAAVKAIDNVTA